MKVLRHLKHLKAHVALLQETHLREEDFPCMRKLWVEEVVGCPSGGRRAGAVVLLHKRLDSLFTDVQRVDEGRLLSLLLKQNSRELRITNVYAMNSPAREYFIRLSSWQANAQHKFHIVTGYFNSVMNEVKDRKTAGHKQSMEAYERG